MLIEIQNTLVVVDSFDAVHRHDEQREKSRYVLKTNFHFMYGYDNWFFFDDKEERDRHFTELVSLLGSHTLVVQESPHNNEEGHQSVLRLDRIRNVTLRTDFNNTIEIALIGHGHGLYRFADPECTLQAYALIRDRMRNYHQNIHG